jgi:hypothetical protein
VKPHLTCSVDPPTNHLQEFADDRLVVVEAALAEAGGVAERLFENHGVIIPADADIDYETDVAGEIEEVRSFNVESPCAVEGGLVLLLTPSSPGRMDDGCS